MNDKYLLASYREVSRRAIDWLLERINVDGSIGPVHERLYYYRAPWTLALMDKRAADSRLLDWIGRQMFSAEGAFIGVSPQGVFESRYGSYPLACLIVGATLLNRFDMVYPGV